MATRRQPSLPKLLQKKIYKTGQTRGADDDVIYQNRVNRNGTVLIPYAFWHLFASTPDWASVYENGFIVLLSPNEYFNNQNIYVELTAKGLALGRNALVFYVTREQWNAYNPDSLNWSPANQRTAPLGGQYVARIAGISGVAENGERINRGFTGTRMKGAGIRAYEYASDAAIVNCRLQLEALFWLCYDADSVAETNGMISEDVLTRKSATFTTCQVRGLLDLEQLTHARMLNATGQTICPLCLEELSGQGFFNRMEQSEGRDVHDFTITQINLFHIVELRNGALNHRPYNLGWGHHHCNVVVKDAGIVETLQWMQSVVTRNIQSGHLPEDANNAN